MTLARTASYGLGTPPPLQLWLHAVLMLFAELLSHAASTLQMVVVRRTRECHTKAAPADLPRATTGIHHEGTATTLILRDRDFVAIVSKDECEARSLSPLMPTNVGIQGETQTLSRPAASSPRTRQNRSWIPTFVGMSGARCGLLQEKSA